MVQPSVVIDEGVPLDETLLLPIQEMIEKAGNARVIIKFKEDRRNIPEQATSLKELGFEQTAAVDAEGMIAGFIDDAVFDALKRNREVAGVYLDTGFSVLLQESLPLIRYDEALSEFGLTGEGIRICLLDTGVDASVVGFCERRWRSL